MVNIDLNRLKYVNDHLGHAEGDALIKDFAEILKDCFAEETVGRIGGDEFMVVARDCRREDVQARIDAAMARAEEASQGRNFPIQFSYGIASSSEVEDPRAEQHGTEKLMKLADERMYNMKAEYYRSTGIERRR